MKKNGRDTLNPNPSTPADRKNGENLVIVKDRRIAVSYMIEALSLFDHYSFRVAEKNAAAFGITVPPELLARADEVRREDHVRTWWKETYEC